MKIFYSDDALFLSYLSGAWCRFASRCILAAWSSQVLGMAVLYNLNVGSVCVCACSVLNMMIGSSVLYQKHLWLTSLQGLRAVTAYGLLQALFWLAHWNSAWALQWHFILGIISTSDTWPLTDKVTWVLMQSLLSLTFFFTKAASLVSLLPMHSFALLSLFRVIFLLLWQYNFSWQPPTGFVGSYSFATDSPFTYRCITST